MPKIFERVDDEVFQRDFGQTFRNKYARLTQEDDQAFMIQAEDNLLWSHIRTAARNDPVLQELLDRCVIHYKLTRK